jgi:glutathione S-transferase
MSYTLFYAPGTASLAVHWMLIELGVAFGAERLDLEAGEQRSPAYLQLNPAGRVPTLLVDGQAYTESAALLMLLAERHPEANLSPASGNAKRGKWLETTVYLANTLSPAMRDWFYAEKDGEMSDAPAVKRLALRRIEGVWDRLNTLLSDGRPYLLGEDVTTADFLGTMLMRWSRNMPRPATDWIHIAPYVIRMRARPSFREVCRREALVDWLNS